MLRGLLAPAPAHTYAASFAKISAADCTIIAFDADANIITIPRHIDIDAADGPTHAAHMQTCIGYYFYGLLGEK